MYRFIFVVLLCYAFSSSPGLAQMQNLDSLYTSPATETELNTIVSNFNIHLLDGTDSLARWSLYNPYLFDPSSPDPSIYPLVNDLRVMREEVFNAPLPIDDNNTYRTVRNCVKNGGINLMLGDYVNAGSGYINLSAAFSFWGSRLSSDLYKPSACSLYPFVYRTQVIVHEARHLEPDDPGHVQVSYDQSLAVEGGYGRACIYLMWIWKHGRNFSAQLRAAAGCEAQSILRGRFIEKPPTHPNPAIQSIVDELSNTTIPTLLADAGRNKNISLPSLESGAEVKLDGSGSYSIYAPLVEYHWLSSKFDFKTASAETTLFLGFGQYHWQLKVRDQFGNESILSDTMWVRIHKSAGVAVGNPGPPAATALLGNFPNPFNSDTEIRYETAAASPVRLDLFAVDGQHLMTLVDGWQGPGPHRLIFRGAHLASGIYFYRLRSDDVTLQRRMLLIR